MRTAVVTAMIALQALGALATVYIIGKPRKPLTAGTAVGTVLLSALFILGIIYLA